jgi:biopolymer transport protein ExbD
MKLRRRQQHKDLHINLIPLIDTLFLLLVFFMMTTTFNQKGIINVSLPQEQSNLNSPPPENATIHVIVNAQGEYAINDVRQTLISNDAQTLKRALQEQGQKSKNPEILLSADAKTPHSLVVRVLEVVGELGYPISIEYEQVRESK